MKFFKFVLLFVLMPVVLMFALSGLLHFLHSWLPNSFTATFSPINESVWQHIKIVFYPFLMVWIIIYFIGKKKHNFTVKQTLISAVFGAILCCLFVINLYYLIHFGFGIGELLVIDLLIEILSLLIAQIIAIHLQMKQKTNNLLFSIAIILLISMIVIIDVFTFVAFNAPIFKAL